MAAGRCTQAEIAGQAAVTGGLAGDHAGQQGTVRIACRCAGCRRSQQFGEAALRGRAGDPDRSWAEALLARILDEDVFVADDHLAGQAPLGRRDVVDVHLVNLGLGDVAEFEQGGDFADVERATHRGALAIDG
jgi:hypothetical protein